MPAGDRTGPLGMGPATGRGMGYCSGNDAPGWANPGPGRRLLGRFGARGPAHVTGWGGGGRGWRHWYYATGLPLWARQGGPPAWAVGAPYAAPSREQEVAMFKEQADWLKQQLESINKRMDELAKE